MLKGIAPILSPDLLKALCEMGHGDQIVLADSNFPSASIGRNSDVIYMSGVKIPELLEAILEVFPLDTYIKEPIILMATEPKDKPMIPIWKEYDKILKRMNMVDITFLDRFAFYEKAKKAYVIVATGETSLYANIILQKGTI